MADNIPTESEEVPLPFPCASFQFHLLVGGCYQCALGHNLRRRPAVATVGKQCLNSAPVTAGEYCSWRLHVCRSWPRSCRRCGRRAWGCSPTGATSRPSRTWWCRSGTTRACSRPTTTRTGTGTCVQVRPASLDNPLPLRFKHKPWTLPRHPWAPGEGAAVSVIARQVPAAPAPVPPVSASLSLLACHYNTWCSAGTVVDRGSHPLESDFYLNSHASIQGTSRHTFIGSCGTRRLHADSTAGPVLPALPHLHALHPHRLPRAPAVQYADLAGECPVQIEPPRGAGMLWKALWTGGCEKDWEDLVTHEVACFSTAVCLCAATRASLYLTGLSGSTRGSGSEGGSQAGDPGRQSVGAGQDAGPSHQGAGSGVTGSSGSSSRRNPSPVPPLLPEVMPVPRLGMFFC